MKPVALDATLWDEPVTGIGLYLRELHRAFQNQGVRVERWGARRSGEHPRRSWSRTLWSVGPLRERLEQQPPALYHALANFNLPLTRVPHVPFVLTVHDLVPMLLPQTVSQAFRWQFQAWLTRSLVVADAVICVSETTRRSLLEHFSVAPSKVTTIHHGVDHVGREPTDRTTEQWLDALGLQSPWVLYAGALDARKNVEQLLGAMAVLQRRGRRVTLVLAGQRWFGSGPVESEIQRLRAHRLDIRPLGYLADPVFYALMRRASVFVFPSRYEGFGLPPLEAMQSGVPTVISNRGALPEICADAAVQVDPDDVEGLAAQLEHLLESPEARAALAARGLARARIYTWARTALATRAVYGQVSPQG
jgi:glycosyltransferase involved in cell wall biosynthesis